MVDEFSQHAWSAEFELAKPSSDMRTLDTLVYKNKVHTSMVALDGSPEEVHPYIAGCLPPWNFHYPIRDNAGSEMLRSPLASEALRLYPISTLIKKSHGSRMIQGYVYATWENSWEFAMDITTGKGLLYGR